MTDSELSLLDRRHRSSQIAEKIGLCRDFGYENISLDLIYGLPGSTLDDLARNLERMLELKPEHISSYLLTLDQDSILYQLIASCEIEAQPNDEQQAEQYELIRQTLISAGFEQYEISNFSLPGKASQHNLAYWESRPYLGLGASASGWLPPHRYTNPSSMTEYYKQISNAVTIPDAQDCSLEQQKADYLMMGLRLIRGIDLLDYRQKFNSDLHQEKRDAIKHLIAIGMLELTDTHLRLTPQALFVSNSVIGELL